MSKGAKNQQGWHGLTVPGDEVPAVPEQGLPEGGSPVSQQPLQPSWPAGSPGSL